MILGMFEMYSCNFPSETIIFVMQLYLPFVFLGVFSKCMCSYESWGIIYFMQQVWSFSELNWMVSFFVQDVIREKLKGNN